MFYFMVNVFLSFIILQSISVKCDEDKTTAHDITTAVPEVTTAASAISVKECPLARMDNGSYKCPIIKKGGAIPKLMQCANKMKKHFTGLCKNKPTVETLIKFKSQCVDVCIMPCIPHNMLGLVTQCGKMEDVSDPTKFNMDTFCNEDKQKEAKTCGTKLFKVNKGKYMEAFNKQIHVICKQCNAFHDCFVRILNEAKHKK